MIDNQRVESAEKVSTLHHGVSNMSQQLLESFIKNDINPIMPSKYDDIVPFEGNL